MKNIFAKSTWILFVMLLCGCNAAKDEGSGSSGGDGIRSVFLDAKDLAVDSIGKSTAESRTRLTTEVISLWVEQNKQALALDVQLSKHNWIEEAQATCAVTSRSSHADITLSIPACRDDVKDKDRAAFLLIHESVHHFGIDDEYFADQVARSIIRAQGSGGHISFPEPREMEIEFNNRSATQLDPFHVCHYQGIDHDVQWDHRPHVTMEYFDGTSWIANYDGIRVQSIGDSKFKILTNEILIETSFVHIENCPLIDIRLRWQ